MEEALVILIVLPARSHDPSQVSGARVSRDLPVTTTRALRSVTSPHNGLSRVVPTHLGRQWDSDDAYAWGRLS